jgi:3-deoxy-manno-octulosonate cytidylyltransferase (CMP-KDO synthetase)
MAAKVVGVIPARLDSKRFYGKVLFEYRGKPLIQHLYEELSKSKEIKRLIIATDNKKIEAAAKSFGAETIMTPPNLRTGTDRVAHLSKFVNGDIFVNVQGDSFGINTGELDKSLRRFRHDKSLEYGTLARKITDDSELNDRDSVKVVLKQNKDAGWFSRQAIPLIRHPRTGPRTRQAKYFYHIGVYFYRRKPLQQFAKWPSTPCEKAESLEQLRILENSRNIKVFVTDMKTFSVDSPKDVKKLKEVFH